MVSSVLVSSLSLDTKIINIHGINLNSNIFWAWILFTYISVLNKVAVACLFLVSYTEPSVQVAV